MTSQKDFEFSQDFTAMTAHRGSGSRNLSFCNSISNILFYLSHSYRRYEDG